MENIGEGSIKINFSGGENANEFIILRGYVNQPNNLDTLGVFYNKPIIIEDLIQGDSYFLSIVASNFLVNQIELEMLRYRAVIKPVNHLIINGFDRTTGTNNTFNFFCSMEALFWLKDMPLIQQQMKHVINDNINIMEYQFINWILGEEGSSTSTFTSLEQDKVKTFLEDGRFLFTSGSEIGYDLVAQVMKAINNFIITI